MNFTPDEKALAIITAYRALVAALIQSGGLEPAIFEHHAIMAIERLSAVGETGASSAAAEMLEPLLVDIRSLVRQPGDGSKPSQKR